MIKELLIKICEDEMRRLEEFATTMNIDIEVGDLPSHGYPRNIRKSLEDKKDKIENDTVLELTIIEVTKCLNTQSITITEASKVMQMFASPDMEMWELGATLLEKFRNRRIKNDGKTSKIEELY